MNAKTATMTETQFKRQMWMHAVCEREYRAAGKTRDADAAKHAAKRLAAAYPQYASK